MQLSLVVTKGTSYGEANFFILIVIDNINADACPYVLYLDAFLGNMRKRTKFTRRK